MVIALPQIMLHVFTYVFFMTAGSTVFAKFWIETTNMGAKDVAKQIERTGMQIPGFRKNPVVSGENLERYIPPVTLFSGAFVGFLAAGADFLGTVGNATGTGLLLAVGIILRTYEQIQKGAGHGDASCPPRVLWGRLLLNLSYLNIFIVFNDSNLNITGKFILLKSLSSLIPLQVGGRYVNWRWRLST